MSLQIISKAEAARMPIAQLRALHQLLSEELANSECGSELAQAIAQNLHIVMNELTARNRLSRYPRR
jgi:type III secretion system FlhB-like substrate exporter